jgi:S-adenosylmethionine:tRNA ribosyltransferase-isomerase
MGDRGMKARGDLLEQRPRPRPATRTPEERGLARDQVRLLVSGPDGHQHAIFHELPDFLRPGTLLVVNTSATLPASLPARAYFGTFTLNLSTRYGDRLWLAEPRWDFARPGPLPFRGGETVDVAGISARLVAPYPGLARLWFVAFDGSAELAMANHGEPIRYGYMDPPFPPLPAYQTIFAVRPGSAEMPSAGRPFSQLVIDRLERQGVRLASLELQTGVSSLETADGLGATVYGEPFSVPAETAAAVNGARREGRPVIAVGTTVVRALESAWDGGAVRAAAGFTRLFVHPGRRVRTVDGLITGFHDPEASHLAMLRAIAEEEAISGAYAEAMREGYLWHEFGDSHLILREPGARS